MSQLVGSTSRGELGTQPLTVTSRDTSGFRVPRPSALDFRP